MIGAELVIGDTGDHELVSRILGEHRVDAVMHFAAHTIVPESVSDPLAYYRNNTCSSRNLLESCSDAGVTRFKNGTVRYDDAYAQFAVSESVRVREDLTLTTTAQWEWDAEAIAAQPVEESVVGFIGAEIDRMDSPSRRAFAVAACIGDRFDLTLLAGALGVSRGRAIEGLAPGLAAERASAAVTRTASTVSGS